MRIVWVAWRDESACHAALGEPYLNITGLTRRDRIAHCMFFVLLSQEDLTHVE